MNEALNISRKEQIEVTATSLFQNKGYAATSMRDLATGLGIEAASIYSHIKSKEEILQNICFKMADEFFDAKETIEKKNLPPIEKLTEAIKGHVRVVTKNAAASAVFFTEYKHLSEPALDEFLQMRTHYEDWFRNIIIDGMKQKKMREVDQKFTILTILSSINFISNWYKPEGKMSADEIGERLSKLFIQGLKS
jgi:TetR/AcrR family transcriptional regulator, cholesterol catabolism regulator